MIPCFNTLRRRASRQNFSSAPVATRWTLQGVTDGKKHQTPRVRQQCLAARRFQLTKGLAHAINDNPHNLENPTLLAHCRQFNVLDIAEFDVERDGNIRRRIVWTNTTFAVAERDITAVIR